MSSSSARKVSEYLSKAREAAKFLTSGPTSFHFEKMQGYAKGLFERFAPFEPGDKVALTKDYPVNEDTSPGWTGYKQMMVEGAVAEVQDVDFDSRTMKFEAIIIFDNEFYITSEGNRYDRQGTDRHKFRFTEDYLEKVDAAT